MKKSHTRTVLLTLVITASLASYLFLSCVSATISGDLISPDQVEEVEEENGERSALPELILIKKVIDVSKRLIPAS